MRTLHLCVFLAAVSFNATAEDVDGFSAEEIGKIRAHGPWPVKSASDPGNEYSGVGWAEKLGSRFFHDPGLSGNQAISCATCHQASKGFADGLAVAEGAGTHVRNTQSLFDLSQQRWFGWDGGADSLWAATLRPLLSEIEMNSTVKAIAAYVRSLPDNTWPADQILSIKSLSDDELTVFVAKLIAAFTRTIESEPTAFDRYRLGLINNKTQALSAYPENAKRGLKLFLGEANCWICHFGPNFSNGEFHDTGRSFFTGVGQVDPGRYTGIKRVRSDRYNLLGEFANVAEQSHAKLKTSTVTLTQANWGQWRTPSLRNLTLTAPYIHDGSISSLRGVVDAYADIDPDRLHNDGEAILKPLSLSEQDREDLVAFLRSLSTQ